MWRFEAVALSYFVSTKECDMFSCVVAYKSVVIRSTINFYTFSVFYGVRFSVIFYNFSNKFLSEKYK